MCRRCSVHPPHTISPSCPSGRPPPCVGRGSHYGTGAPQGRGFPGLHREEPCDGMRAGITGQPSSCFTAPGAPCQGRSGSARAPPANSIPIARLQSCLSARCPGSPFSLPGGFQARSYGWTQQDGPCHGVRGAGCRKGRKLRHLVRPRLFPALLMAGNGLCWECCSSHFSIHADLHQPTATIAAMEEANGAARMAPKG